MSIYCTYLTTYFGSKLPPFYIGSTTVIKVESGYHGSVSSKKYKQIWKSELKQNPHLFKTKILRTFETRIEAYLSEEKIQRKLNVIEHEMYINKSIARSKLNRTNIKHTDESKLKMSKSHLGVKLSATHVYNMAKSRIGRKHIDESKLKMSKAKIGKTPSDTTRNKMSKSAKARTNLAQCAKNMQMSNIGRKHSDETKQKLRQSKLGKPMNFPKVICPYCGKIGGNNVMKRHHFDNCKSKEFDMVQKLSTAILN